MVVFLEELPAAIPSISRCASLAEVGDGGDARSDGAFGEVAEAEDELRRGGRSGRAVGAHAVEADGAGSGGGDDGLLDSSTDSGAPVPGVLQRHPPHSRAGQYAQDKVEPLAEPFCLVPGLW
jgi:hypothetical protein